MRQSARRRRLYKRRVNNNGSIQIGGHRYYIRRTLAKQEVAIRLDAQEKQLQIFHNQQLIKTAPLKGLYHGQMALADYTDCICREAVSEARRLRQRRRQRRRRRSKQ